MSKSALIPVANISARNVARRTVSTMNLVQGRLSAEAIAISIAPRTYRDNSAVRLSLYGKSKKMPGCWWQTGKLFHSGDGDFPYGLCRCKRLIALVPNSRSGTEWQCCATRGSPYSVEPKKAEAVEKAECR